MQVNNLTPQRVREWINGNQYFSGYCIQQGSDIYVPYHNRYPHIHVGGDFVVYSRSPNNHSFLIQGANIFMNRITQVLQDTHEVHIDQICRFLLSQG